jgi:hypothetical protein
LWLLIVSQTLIGHKSFPFWHLLERVGGQRGRGEANGQCLPRLALPLNGMGGNGKAGLGFVFGVALALAFIFDEEPSTHTTWSALDTSGDNTHGQVQKKRREKKKERKIDEQKHIWMEWKK